MPTLRAIRLFSQAGGKNVRTASHVALIAVRPSAPVIRLAKNGGTGVLAGGAFTQIDQVVGELISHSGICYFRNRWSKSPKVAVFINPQALIGLYASTVSSDGLGSSVHQQQITYEATEETDHE